MKSITNNGIKWSPKGHVQLSNCTYLYGVLRNLGNGKNSIPYFTHTSYPLSFMIAEIWQPKNDNNNKMCHEIFHSDTTRGYSNKICCTGHERIEQKNVKQLNYCLLLLSHSAPRFNHFRLGVFFFFFFLLVFGSVLSRL